MSRADIHQDRGAITVLFVVLSIAVVTCLLVVVSLGQRLDLLSRSMDLASEAARYGASWVDEASIGAGTPRLDIAQAKSGAEDFAHEAGASEVEVVVDALNNSVTVTLTLTAENPISGTAVSASASHRAFLIVRDPDG